MSVSIRILLASSLSSGQLPSGFRIYNVIIFSLVHRKISISRRFSFLASQWRKLLFDSLYYLQFLYIPNLNSNFSVPQRWRRPVKSFYNSNFSSDTFFKQHCNFSRKVYLACSIVLSSWTFISYECWILLKQYFYGCGQLQYRNQILVRFVNLSLPKLAN